MIKLAKKSCVKKRVATIKGRDPESISGDNSTPMDKISYQVFEGYSSRRSRSARLMSNARRGSRVGRASLGGGTRRKKF